MFLGGVNMARAPFQVLILLYRITNDRVEYCIFNRSDFKAGLWQFVSGGGEDGETHLEAAKRELQEETALKHNDSLRSLKTITSIPSCHFKEIVNNYPDLYVIPEYSFAMEVVGYIKLSHEHSEFRWLDSDEAMDLLKYDSNKTALYELSMILVNK